MASPSPNPKSGDEGGPEETPSTSSPATRLSSARFVTTPDSQLPTKLQYVPLGAPGPSGIKQCFRTVKQLRRVPTLGSPASARSSPSPASSSSRATTSSSSRRSDKGKRHACNTCDKRFSSPGKLQQHQLCHTGELPFSCQLCDKKFNSKFKLSRHMSIHSESRAFACNVCGRKFNRKDHLNNHARVHNPVKKLHTCERPGCHKEYTSLLSYRKHIALHAAEEGCLDCEICGDSFETRDEIIYHLKVHTGSRTIKSDIDKKFTCSFCGRRFFTGKDVRRHLVVHTGRRDFQCPFCPQKFGRKDHLVRHVKNAHPDETWRPTPTPAATKEPVTQVKVEQEVVPAEEITFIDFPLDSAQLEALLKQEAEPESEPQPGPSGVRTRIPSSEIIVEVTPHEIKEEPVEEESLSPRSTTSHDPLLDYPGQMVYLIPPAPTSPYAELELVDPAAVESLLGQSESSTGEQLIQLLDDEEFNQQQQAPQQQRSTPLPAFTQAFQSAQSPKPPPPPPPPSL